MKPSSAVDLTQVGKISHPTLSQRVYDNLRELLLSGQVHPGQKLTLKGLSEAMGTSQTPVREAIRQLAAEGALEILPNSAIRVPLMNKGQFRELLKIRLALEGMAVETAAQRITPTQLQEVAALHAALSQEMRRSEPDVVRVIGLNKQLHFSVYRACDMPILIALIESIWLRVGPVLNLDMGSGSRRLSEAPALEHHASLFEGLQNGSAEQSRRGLERDLISSAQMILEGPGLPD